jgi:hypothetical protein
MNKETETPKCSKCAYLVFVDSGYSNWTVEETTACHILGLNPILPGETSSKQDAALDEELDCNAYLEGTPTTIDVEEESGTGNYDEPDHVRLLPYFDNEDGARRNSTIQMGETMNIEDAPKLSRYNRVQVEAAEVCGCYFCQRVYPASDVVEYEEEEQTALCPCCGINAVLPGVTDEAVLIAALERWFTRVGD